MSDVACHMHGGLDGGRRRGVYAALLVDGFRFSTYQKYCQDCLARLMFEHRSDWLPGSIRTKQIGHTACTSCGEIVDTEAKLRPFYVTCYGPGAHRSDYFGLYCDSCADLVKNTWALEESRSGRH